MLRSSSATRFGRRGSFSKKSSDTVKSKNPTADAINGKPPVWNGYDRTFRNSYVHASTGNVHSPERQEMEELHLLEKDVFFAMRYFQDVVEKNTVELLAGSTTVVLENIFGLESHIRNSFKRQQTEDTFISSELKEVYRYLAVLVSWSDGILLRRADKALQGIPMRRHTHIIPSIIALRKHTQAVVERYKNLLTTRIGPQVSLRKAPLSGSAESLAVAGYNRSLNRGSGSMTGINRLHFNGTSPEDTTDSHFFYGKDGDSLLSTPNSGTSGVGSQSDGYRQSTPSTPSLHSRSPSPILPPPPFFLGNGSIYSDSALHSPLSTYNGHASPNGYWNSVPKNCSTSTKFNPDEHVYEFIGNGHLRNPSPLNRSSSEDASFSRVPNGTSPKRNGYESSQSTLRAVPSFSRSYTIDLGTSDGNRQQKDQAPPLPPKKSKNPDSGLELLEELGMDTVDDYGTIKNSKLPPKAYLDNRDICPMTAKSKWFQTRMQNSVSRSQSIDTPIVPRGSVEKLTSVTNDVEPHSSSYSDMLMRLDAADQLVFLRSAQGKMDLRGGPVDALIVEATKATRKDFNFQEAFVMTYRTFIDSTTLINKLLHRFSVFSTSSEPQKQAASRSSFALLLRVMDELCLSEAFDENSILQKLLDFVNQLVAKGDLSMARGLRKKILDKYDLLQKNRNQSMLLLPIPRRGRRMAFLLDFKSQDLAEQLTLLDGELFKRIEITEFLCWTKDQSEDRSPNLTAFTEHFNKVSYWARTRILDNFDQREREKNFAKFIKIMRCLRKLGNFSSLLAILAAVDCAPVRRLDFSKSQVEALTEMSTIIDSSQSFRTYRTALASVQPPCIPYIGVALSDLTFVNENPDWLDGETHSVVNFSKRWQQYQILFQLIRFQKTCQYSFKRIDDIVQFFDNFDNHLPEEKLWQISEAIKPRGGQRNGAHVHR